MKKVLVVFDTKFGNTEQVGREIAAGIEETGMAECKVVGIKEVGADDISNYDGVLFGGPVHAFRATRGIKGAIKKAAKMGIDGRLVSSFDTYEAPGHKGNAVRGIEGEVSKRVPRAEIFTPGFTARVDGYEGPLNAAEPARAREFGRRFAEKLGE